MEKSLYYESDAIILIALCLYGSSFNGPKKGEKQNKYDAHSPTIIRLNRGARLKAQHSAGITSSKMTHSTEAQRRSFLQPDSRRANIWTQLVGQSVS